jgi:hypothetical protein
VVTEKGLETGVAIATTLGACVQQHLFMVARLRACFAAGFG